MDSGRKLLILDLDETLIYATDEPLDREADFRVGQYHVYRRPHLEAFLTTCREWFDLAVWSSSTPAYTAAVVDAIFPRPDELAFVWGRERCTPDHDGFGEPCWRKTLRKVTRRGFRAGSIVVVDDSPEKWTQSYGNLVRVTPFLGDSQDVELAHLLPYLDTLRTVENVRTVEKRFWRTVGRNASVSHVLQSEPGE